MMEEEGAGGKYRLWERVDRYGGLGVDMGGCSGKF